jgi:hypothetical protein
LILLDVGAKARFSRPGSWLSIHLVDLPAKEKITEERSRGKDGKRKVVFFCSLRVSEFFWHQKLSVCCGIVGTA